MTPISLIKVIQAIQQKEAKQKGITHPDIFNNQKNVIITAEKGFMKVDVSQNNAT